ncbi:hypothetical protein MRX96_007262 [Rhipicephalus microplus]
MTCQGWGGAKKRHPWKGRISFLWCDVCAEHLSPMRKKPRSEILKLPAHASEERPDGYAVSPHHLCLACWRIVDRQRSGVPSGDARVRFHFGEHVLGRPQRLGADLIFRQLGAAAAFPASEIVPGEMEERHGHRPLVPLHHPHFRHCANWKKANTWLIDTGTGRREGWQGDILILPSTPREHRSLRK